MVVFGSHPCHDEDVLFCVGGMETIWLRLCCFPMRDLQCKSIGRSHLCWSISRDLKLNLDGKTSTLKWNAISMAARHHRHTQPLLASRFRQAAWRPEKRARQRPQTRQISIRQGFRADLTADFAISCRLLVTPQASTHFYHENVHEIDIDRWGRSQPSIVCLRPEIALPTRASQPH
jgi:hypothetical protein